MARGILVTSRGISLQSRLGKPDTAGRDAASMPALWGLLGEQMGCFLIRCALQLWHSFRLVELGERCGYIQTGQSSSPAAEMSCRVECVERGYGECVRTRE